MLQYVDLDLYKLSSMGVKGPSHVKVKHSLKCILRAK